MAQTDTQRPAAKEIIDTLAEAMRAGLERIDKQYVLVPASYEVFIHADAYQDLEPIFKVIRQRGAVRLDEELSKLNDGSTVLGWARRLVQPDRDPVKYERSGRSWHIDIYPTHDVDADPGYIAVVAELVPPKDGSASGPKTRRLTVRDLTGGFSTQILDEEKEQPDPSVPSRNTVRTSAQGREEHIGHGKKPLARLTFTDDAGERSVMLTGIETAIGRKDEAYEWVGVKLDTVDDVSREHLRIRYNQGEERFAIKDLSSFGTTVAEAHRPDDQRTVASSIDPETGNDLERWEPLPDKAVIGLADIIFIDFEALV
jgi:hypothetical protein